MANLIVDIGNTLTKIAIFDSDKVIYTTNHQNLQKEFLASLITDYNIKNLVVSTVKEVTDITFFDSFSQLKPLLFTHKTKIPVKNSYATPETLGLDRLAAVIGAKELFPLNAVLVIDIGTCITFDFIDVNREYKGGNISPGLRMRLKAMNHFTSKLPNIEVDLDAIVAPNIGKTTHEAMLSGVINGMLFEIEGYIRQFSHENSSLKIILCGGDASFFDTRLKNSIFAHQILLEPKLVLIGLNTVVNYQND